MKIENKTKVNRYKILSKQTRDSNLVLRWVSTNPKTSPKLAKPEPERLEFSKNLTWIKPKSQRLQTYLKFKVIQNPKYLLQT